MTNKMIEQKTLDGAHSVQASIHHETGNLRLSVRNQTHKPSAFFFPDTTAAVDFLEEVLEMIDPEDSQ